MTALASRRIQEGSAIRATKFVIGDRVKISVSTQLSDMNPENSLYNKEGVITDISTPDIWCVPGREEDQLYWVLVEGATNTIISSKDGKPMRFIHPLYESELRHLEDDSDK